MVRKLQRSEQRTIAGVCSGIGDYFSVDPTVVRLVFAGLVLFRGLGLALYGICWLVLPEQEGGSVLDRLMNDRDQLLSGNVDSKAAGLALLVIGLLLLMHTVAPFLTWTTVGSAVLIGGGVVLIYLAWKENGDGDE